MEGGGTDAEPFNEDKQRCEERQELEEGLVPASSTLSSLSHENGDHERCQRSLAASPPPSVERAPAVGHGAEISEGRAKPAKVLASDAPPEQESLLSHFSYRRDFANETTSDCSFPGTIGGPEHQRQGLSKRGEEKGKLLSFFSEGCPDDGAEKSGGAFPSTLNTSKSGGKEEPQALAQDIFQMDPPIGPTVQQRLMVSAGPLVSGQILLPEVTLERPSTCPESELSPPEIVSIRWEKDTTIVRRGVESDNGVASLASQAEFAEEGDSLVEEEEGSDIGGSLDTGKMSERLSLDASPRAASVTEMNGKISSVTARRRFHFHERRQRTNCPVSQSQGPPTQITTRTFVPRRTQSMRKPNGSDQEEDDEALLLMIAKARAAMGDSDDEEAEEIEMDLDDDIGELKEKRRPRRGRQLSDTDECARPGAYSKAPGQSFRRNRSFERVNFQVSRRKLPPECLERAKLPTPTSSESPPPVRRRRRGGRKPGHKKVVRGEELLEDDRKPPARPTITQHHHMTSEETLKAFGGSSHRRRFSNLSTASGVTIDSGDGNHTKASRKLRPSLKRKGTNITERSSLRLSALARTFARTNSSQWTSSSSKFSGSNDPSSEKLIASLTEQSVSNFMKSFHSSMSSLPIAAQVVPSEEDLENLIRTRLETELRTHLSQELENFRHQLFQEMIIQKGQLQVADPVDLETGDGAAHDLGYTDTWSNDDLMESFQDEEEDLSEETDTHTEPCDEQVASVEAPIESASVRSRRMPVLPESFRRSIRESLAQQLEGLEDELDMQSFAEARVIASEPLDIDGSNQPTHSSTQYDEQFRRMSSSSSMGYRRRRHHRQKWMRTMITVGKAGRIQEFVFTSRGLLGCLFLMFLFGALVGAVTSILAMLSARD